MKQGQSSTPADIPVNTIKRCLLSHFWTHFRNNFDPDRACSFHNYVCVTDAPVNLLTQTLMNYE